MSAAAYRAPVADGEYGAAECVIYSLGRTAAGFVEANLQRLREAFKGPGGKEELSRARILRLHGLPITSIDVSRNYGGSGSTAAPAYVAKRGWRMPGAIIEAPEGKLLIQFAGPPKTVGQNQEMFCQLLDSFERQ